MESLAPADLGPDFSGAAELADQIACDHRGLIETRSGGAAKFVFGAWEESPHHPSDALAAVLDMREAVRRTYGSPTGGGLSLSAGIATGKLVLGHIGTSVRFPYGAWGYADFVALRSEEANQRLATSALMAERTADLVSDQLLVRPVGLLRLRDLPTPVRAYEPVGRLADATHAQREFVRLSRQAVYALAAERFGDCLAVLDQIGPVVGADKWVEVFRSAATRYAAKPLPADYDGRIELPEG